MKDKEIMISVSKGNLSYAGEPVGDPVVVKPGSKIKWTCNEPSFAIHLGWDSPCEKGRYRSDKGNSVTAQVRKNARPGTYKYSVAVSVAGKIWTDDPQIIIPE